MDSGTRAAQRAQRAGAWLTRAMDRTATRAPVIVVACLSIFLSGGAAEAQRGGADEDEYRRSEQQLQYEAELKKAIRKYRVDYCEDLEEASEWAAENGLREQAIDLWREIYYLVSDYEGLPDLKEKIKESPEKPAEDADTEKLIERLSSKKESASEKHGKKLYSLSLKCFQAGLFSRAYDLLLEVLELSPDPRDSTQKKARSILGYEWDRENERWVTRWTAEMMDDHYLTDEGWVRNRDRKKWESGERQYKGKWVTIEEEKRIRSRNEYNPYLVESENFVVKTNLGREEAWRYAQILEDFNRAFYRVFIGYYDQVAGAKLLFKQAENKSKHEVYIFPSREAYLVHVKGEQGNNELLLRSAGFYSHSQRISRFYWSEDISSTLNTLYHEIAHQLFAETKSTSAGGSRGNNWVVEGIATYIETWQKRDGEWEPGGNLGSDIFRMTSHLLENNAPPLLGGFIRMGHEEFHEDQQKRQFHYSMAGALCHFFLHYEDEIYKEDFVRFLSAYYAGRVEENSLLDYISVPEAKDFDVLEKQFREYIGEIKKKVERVERKKREQGGSS